MPTDKIYRLKSASMSFFSELSPREFSAVCQHCELVATLSLCREYFREGLTSTLEMKVRKSKHGFLFEHNPREICTVGHIAPAFSA